MRKHGAQDQDGFKSFATSISYIVCKRDFFSLTEWLSYQRTTFAVRLFSQLREDITCLLYVWHVLLAKKR